MPTVNKQILTFDTSIARPRNFQIFRGETVIVECALTNYINPIDLTGMTASAYWRSKAMAEESSDLWYNGTVEIVNGKVVWTWDTSNDDGSDGYEWFIKVTGSGNLSYRAFGHIEMLGSPSTNPSIGPTPQSNYYTKDETDAHISQATEHLVPDTREINGHALNADVNLTASDVGALPDTYVAPVTSVNTKTGVVTLTASDVGALPDTYTAPVTSVNTKTGIVTLTASDVGAQTPLTFDNVPTENSSNPVTSDGIKTAITVNNSFSEWTFTATPSTGISNISAYYYEEEFGWFVSATLSIDGQSIPVTVPTDAHDPDAISLTATFSGQETWVVSGTRELESRIIGNQTSKPLQPAGDYALKSEIPAVPVKAVKQNGTSLTPDANGAVDVTVPEVVAPSSTAVTGQAADASATWTGLSGVQTSITETRIQMALENGAFALPQTVVEFYDGHTELLALSGIVDFDSLSTALGPLETPITGDQQVKRITFGTDVLLVNIGPHLTWPTSVSSLTEFEVTLQEDEQTVLAMQDYLYTRFRACESIEIPLNLRGFGFDLGGDILDYSYAGGNATLNEYTFKAQLHLWSSSNANLQAFAFSGWQSLRKIVYPFGYGEGSQGARLKIMPHFIDGCTSLEVLDLRYVEPQCFYASVKVGKRFTQVALEPIIQNVNPNLKIIVRDDYYTQMMGITIWATWQPYLVKASDWEYVHHSELADYATSTDVATAISTATSGLVDQTELNSAISTAVSGKQDTLTFDNTPTANSNNPVKSSGIKTALDGKASTADATLTPYYSGGTPTYSEWVCDPPEATVGWDTTQFDGWYIEYDGVSTAGSSDPDATSLSANFGATTVTATRTITNFVGYVLGSQTDKPLQPAGDYAASSSTELVKQFTEWTVVSNNPNSVFPPYSMEWITDGNGYSYWVLHSGNDATWAFNPAGMNHDATYLSTDDIATCERTFTGYVLGNQTDKELQAAGNYALKSEIPAISAETWNFTLEDGTTLTKSVAVY